VAAFFLAAVDRAGGQARVALTAHHLVAVVLAGQDLQGRLDDTTTQAEHQVEGGLLLDVVVGQGAAVFQLLTGEDQTLLIRRDALLVLDLGLHVLDRVGTLDIEGNGLTRQRLDENLHLELVLLESNLLVKILNTKPMFVFKCEVKLVGRIYVLDFEVEESKRQAKSESHEDRRRRKIASQDSLGR